MPQFLPGVSDPVQAAQDEGVAEPGVGYPATNRHDYWDGAQPRYLVM